VWFAPKCQPVCADWHFLWAKRWQARKTRLGGGQNSGYGEEKHAAGDISFIEAYAINAMPNAEFCVLPP
jgi:hypothetical protein